MKSNSNQEKTEFQSLGLICIDMDQWPDSWAGEKNDIPVGNKLHNVFQCYLIQLMNKGRTKETIRKHANYLWALGGEIIRDTNENGAPQEVTDSELILQYIDNEGGPFWRHANDDYDHQPQFDSICRQLYKYLSQPMN